MLWPSLPAKTPFLRNNLQPTARFSKSYTLLTKNPRPSALKDKASKPASLLLNKILLVLMPLSPHLTPHSPTSLREQQQEVEVRRQQSPVPPSSMVLLRISALLLRSYR